jgi:hypothetical protein
VEATNGAVPRGLDRSGSPKISMKPTAAAWSKASPSSYVARLLSYSDSGERRPATTACP